MRATTLVLVILAAGAAIWYFTRPAPSLTAKPVTPVTADGSPVVQAADVSAIPAPWNARLDASSSELKSAASAWPAAPEALVAKIASTIAVRDSEMDFEPGAPHSAQTLASRAEGLRAGSLEMASLAAAVMRANGGQAELGFLSEHRHSATSILLRRYVVRAPKGGWLDPSTGTPSQGAVTPLSDAGVLANTLALRAMIFVDHQKGDEASKAAGFAKRLAPEDPAVLFAYGEVQLFNDLTDMGMASLEAVAKKHADAMTWQTLGEYAAQNRQFFKAQQFFGKAAAADPAFARPHIMMAQLSLERLEVTPKDQHQALFGQLESHLAKASEVDPNAAGIRTMRAQAAAARGDAEAAETLMREEVKLHPKSRNAALSLAQQLLQQRKLEAATAVLEAAVKRGVPGYEVLVALGGMLAAQELPDKAKGYLERALELAPHDPRLRPQVAQLYLMQEQPQNAQKLLQEQIKRFPDDVDAPLLLVQIAIRSQDWKAATGFLNDMSGEAAQRPEVAVLRYIVALATGEGVAKTEAAAVRALQGRRSNLAQLLLEQGMLPQAEKLLRDSVAKSPEDDQAPYMLVAMLTAQARATDAQAVVDQVIKAAAPDKVEALKRRFQMAIEQGQKVSRPLPVAPEVAPGAAQPAPADNPAGTSKSGDK